MVPNRATHHKYQMHLEDQRQKRISMEAETKAIHLSNEIKTLKGQVEQMSSCYERSGYDEC